MKNKTYLIAVLVFAIGIIMMFGTSYSLIVHKAIIGKEYVFDVSLKEDVFINNVEVEIRTKSIDDNEYLFTITNNNDFDINYRLDILENDLLNMGENIYYTYNLNNSEYESYQTLKDNSTIKQNRVIKSKQKDIYKLRIWLANDVKKKVSAIITLSATKDYHKYATSIVEDMNHKDDFTDNIYRYNDTNPSNYIWFNCQENYTSGNDHCEKWRIIGSFDNKLENSDEEYKSLKITSNKVFSRIPFNNNSAYDQFDKSYVYTYANGYYYDLLNNHAKNLIQKSQFFFGNTSGFSYDMTKEEEKENSIYTYVGLLNLSDYLSIGVNSWLINKPGIMLISKDNNLVNVIDNRLTGMYDSNEYSFVPVVYLRSDVSFNSGDGSFDNPYELIIKYPLNLGRSK